MPPLSEMTLTNQERSAGCMKIAEGRGLALVTTRNKNTAPLKEKKNEIPAICNEMISWSNDFAPCV